MKKILVVLIIISLFISGCSSTLSKSSNNQDMYEDGTESFLAEGESEMGKLTVFKKNDEVEAIQESGPFTVKINKMQVSELEVGEKYKRTFFDNKDVVTIITLEVEAENKSTETNIIPDQGMIVTNTKEQKDAHEVFSVMPDGAYIGEIISEGNVYFVLDSEAEEITSFKYVIPGPIDSDGNKLGEDITFDLSLD
ncbi:hypothetical protein KQI41_10240 [Tissierella pigra]|uniref:DUF4352 domain-containing protein n=1 Tax=Tissierella pigra TaxID=2607614 RepID=A0A6N7XH33_9FIRM|nr:hypothetical protein [Tissierella pigra]MBU5426787.1 hypothetical protein [Tissierella pigra]MSU01339.1 hypothetical protein [Tissierella pigra]